MAILILGHTEGTGAPGSCPGDWIQNYTGTNNGTNTAPTPGAWMDGCLLSDTKMIVAGGTSFNSAFRGSIYSISDTTMTFGATSIIDSTIGFHNNRLVGIDETLAFTIETRDGSPDRTQLWQLNISGNTITPQLRFVLNTTSPGAANQAITANTSNTLIAMGYQDQGGALDTVVRLWNYTHNKISAVYKPFGSTNMMSFSNAADIFFMSPTRLVYVANQNDSGDSKRIALMSVDPGDAVTNPSLSTLSTATINLAGTGNVPWVAACKMTDTDCLIAYTMPGGTEPLYANRFSTAGDTITVHNGNEVVTPDTSGSRLWPYRLARVNDTEAVLIHSTRVEANEYQNVATVLCSSANDVDTITAGSEISLSGFGSAAQAHYSAHTFSDDNRILVVGSAQQNNGNAQILKHTT